MKSQLEIQARVLESMAEGVVTVDEEGIISYVNPTFARMFGYGPGELCGQQVVVLGACPEAAGERVFREINGEVARTGLWSGEFHNRRRDGSLFHTRARITPLEIFGKRYLIAVHDDITVQKRMAEELRQSEERYRLLVDFSPDAIIVHSEGRYIFGNRAAQRLLRAECAAQLVGMPVMEIVHPDFREVVRERIRLMEESGTPSPLRELKLIRLDGTVFDAETTGAQIMYQGTPAFQIIVRDISERKRVEEELKKVHDRLEERVVERTVDLATTVETLLEEITERKKVEEALQAETRERLRALEELCAKEHLLMQQSRMAAMGEMIGNIAHQWRQPLNTLGLIVQQLAAFYETEDFSGELLESCTEKAMELIFHMSQTIDDFRSFFRPDKDMVLFDARETIAKALSLIDGSFRNQQILVTFDAPAELAIFGFPNELSQVLLNILGNARDAFAGKEVDRPRVAVRLFAEGGRIVVTIADNAGGIPEEVLGRIFDPYFTTKGPQGTGIGLFMAKTIVEKNMHGSLSARNCGDGAEFRIEVENGADAMHGL